MKKTPSTNRDNGGRSKNGRFGKGNAGGPGNPFAAKVAKLRSALLDSVTQTDFKAIVKGLVTRAKNGDVVAAKVLFERTLGKPIEPDLIERIERLETLTEDKRP